MANKPFTVFLAYNPKIKPLGENTGGGFSFSMSVPEDQWEAIKELNDPALKGESFQVVLVKEA